MTIGIANICSSVQDHRQKFICLKFKYWFWKNKREQWKLQWKLVLQDRVWRSSEVDCQKLTSSESLKIIRSWSSSESGDWKLKLVKVSYSEDTSLQKE